MPEPKKVAAIITEYRRHSHADVIVGKILEGFRHDGGKGPDLKLASAYIDQFPPTDMSKELQKKYGFRICDSIAEAITLGGKTIAVDGVLVIGEHGKYPFNELGQHLYPRRRFFEGVIDVFARTKKSVPVFNDKHLSTNWKDAKWMYDRAREHFAPFLAGSSLPLTWRRPPLKLPRGVELVEAVQIGYGGLESYGFHALESLQCMAERRKGGETGVKSVQFLQGEDMWKAMDDGRWSKALLEAAMTHVPLHAKGDYRTLTSRSKSAGVFLIEYLDGFRAAVAMMNGWAYEGDGGAFCFAGKIKGQEKPVGCLFYLQNEDPFGHFAYLVKAIESMLQTGHAPYPVERTLLTTGMLEAGMIGKSQNGRRIETPYLKIAYQPTDYPFATDPVPEPIKR